MVALRLYKSNYTVKIIRSDTFEFYDKERSLGTLEGKSIAVEQYDVR